MFGRNRHTFPIKVIWLLSIILFWRLKCYSSSSENLLLREKKLQRNSQFVNSKAVNVGLRPIATGLVMSSIELAKVTLKNEA